MSPEQDHTGPGALGSSGQGSRDRNAVRGAAGGGASRLMVEWRALAERFRTSLFGLPSLWIVGSLLLWLAMREVDDVLDVDQLPGVFETTVDSARSLLGAVASGTIAAASVVFSLTLVAIQLSSNAYSSRVLRTFLRDRFQQNMMGIVLATFFYSLLVLRDVRGPLSDGGEANVPSASVTLATVFALAAVLALLASISHTAQSVRVSHVSSSVRRDTRSVIIARLGAVRSAQTSGSGVEPTTARAASVGTADGSSTTGRGDAGDPGVPFDVQAPGVIPSPLAMATGDRVELCDPPTGVVPLVIEAPVGGWVQQISTRALIAAIGEVALPRVQVRLEVAVGTYVSAGAPLVALWPAEAPPDGHGEDEHRQGDHATGESGPLRWLGSGDPQRLAQEVRGGVRVGAERTLQQDIAFGLTMLEDMALRALSPGINDPNTAASIIPQLGELLLEILLRDLPPVRVEVGGITLLRPVAPSYSDYIEAAFGQIRRVSADQPVVRLTMVRTLATIASELERRSASVPEVMAALRDAATALVPSESDESDVPRDDPAAVAARELLAINAWFSRVG